MLAAERKTEMGISRALGTQRENLVQMFLFEGVAYDLAAAAIGAMLGVGVAYVMVLGHGVALASFGFASEHDRAHAEPGRSPTRSAYCSRLSS